MADDDLTERVPNAPSPDPKKVTTRAEGVPEEEAGEDPDVQAEAILTESEARTFDPATRDLDDDSIERSTSEVRVEDGGPGG